MKQTVIKIICIVFANVAGILTTCASAQEPEISWLKMMPEIPTDLTEPDQRAAFLVAHFWDQFNLNDTSFLMTNHLLERCFIEYIDLLSLVPDELRDQSIQSFLKKSEDEGNLFTFIISLSEKYLYEPESPLCNDEKLIPFLQYALGSSILNESEKFRLNYLLDCISKNRIGNIANDFTYTLMNGETGNLHTIEAEYTLLYFNDPDCDDCRMLIRQLTVSPIISQYVQAGRLKIITFYVNDDLDTWKKHAREVSHSWIYAYDAEQIINAETIYNIKQFPALYLLNQYKKVILKDLTFETLEDYFRSP